MVNTINRFYDGLIPSRVIVCRVKPSCNMDLLIPDGVLPIDSKIALPDKKINYTHTIACKKNMPLVYAAYSQETIPQKKDPFFWMSLPQYKRHILSYVSSRSP